MSSSQQTTALHCFKPLLFSKSITLLKQLNKTTNYPSHALSKSALSTLLMKFESISTTLLKQRRSVQANVYQNKNTCLFSSSPHLSLFPLTMRTHNTQPLSTSKSRYSTSNHSSMKNKYPQCLNQSHQMTNQSRHLSTTNTPKPQPQPAAPPIPSSNPTYSPPPRQIPQPIETGPRYQGKAPPAQIPAPKIDINQPQTSQSKLKLAISRLLPARFTNSPNSQEPGANRFVPIRGDLPLVNGQVTQTPLLIKTKIFLKKFLKFSIYASVWGLALVSAGWYTYQMIGGYPGAINIKIIDILRKFRIFFSNTGDLNVYNNDINSDLEFHYTLGTNLIDNIKNAQRFILKENYTVQQSTRFLFSTAALTKEWATSRLELLDSLVYIMNQFELYTQMQQMSSVLLQYEQKLRKLDHEWVDVMNNDSYDDDVNESTNDPDNPTTTPSTSYDPNQYYYTPSGLKIPINLLEAQIIAPESHIEHVPWIKLDLGYLELQKRRFLDIYLTTLNYTIEEQSNIHPLQLPAIIHDEKTVKSDRFMNDLTRRKRAILAQRLTLLAQIEAIRYQQIQLAKFPSTSLLLSREYEDQARTFGEEFYPEIYLKDLQQELDQLKELAIQQQEIEQASKDVRAQHEIEKYAAEHGIETPMDRIKGAMGITPQWLIEGMEKRRKNDSSEQQQQDDDDDYDDDKLADPSTMSIYDFNEMKRNRRRSDNNGDYDDHDEDDDEFETNTDRYLANPADDGEGDVIFYSSTFSEQQEPSSLYLAIEKSLDDATSDKSFDFKGYDREQEEKNNIEDNDDDITSAVKSITKSSSTDKPTKTSPSQFKFRSGQMLRDLAQPDDNTPKFTPHPIFSYATIDPTLIGSYIPSQHIGKNSQTLDPEREYIQRLLSNTFGPDAASNVLAGVELIPQTRQYQYFSKQITSLYQINYVLRGLLKQIEHYEKNASSLVDKVMEIEMIANVKMDLTEEDLDPTAPSTREKKSTFFPDLVEKVSSLVFQKKGGDDNDNVAPPSQSIIDITELDPYDRARSMRLSAEQVLSQFNDLLYNTTALRLNVNEITSSFQNDIQRFIKWEANTYRLDQIVDQAHAVAEFIEYSKSDDYTFDATALHQAHLQGKEPKLKASLEMLTNLLIIDQNNTPTNPSNKDTSNQVQIGPDGSILPSRSQQELENFNNSTEYQQQETLLNLLRPSSLGSFQLPPRGLNITPGSYFTTLEKQFPPPIFSTPGASALNSKDGEDGKEKENISPIQRLSQLNHDNATALGYRIDPNNPVSRHYYQFTGDDLRDFFAQSNEVPTSYPISADLSPLIQKVEDYLNLRFRRLQFEESGQDGLLSLGNNLPIMTTRKGTEKVILFGNDNLLTQTNNDTNNLSDLLLDDDGTILLSGVDEAVSYEKYQQRNQYRQRLLDSNDDDELQPLRYIDGLTGRGKGGKLISLSSTPNANPSIQKGINGKNNINIFDNYDEKKDTNRMNNNWNNLDIGTKSANTLTKLPTPLVEPKPINYITLDNTLSTLKNTIKDKVSLLPQTTNFIPPSNPLHITVNPGTIQPNNGKSDDGADNQTHKMQRPVWNTEKYMSDQQSWYSSSSPLLGNQTNQSITPDVKSPISVSMDSSNTSNLIKVDFQNQDADEEMEEGEVDYEFAFPEEQLSELFSTHNRLSDYILRDDTPYLADSESNATFTADDNDD